MPDNENGEPKEMATVDKSEPFPVTAGKGLIPTSLSQMWRLANIIAQSAFAPKGMEKAESIFVAIDYGLSFGIAPLQAMQNIAVINGRPSIYGDLMLGIVQADEIPTGGKTLQDLDEHFEGEDGTDEFAAVCIAKRRDRETPIERRFSIKDAKIAGC